MNKIKRSASEFDIAHSTNFSRRQFLKLSAISAVGATAIFKLPWQMIAMDLSGFNESDTSWDQVLNQVCSSPMYQEANAELANQGFQFTCHPSYVTSHSLNGSLFGAVLRHSRTPNPRMGANILITFDLSQEQLYAVEFLNGWCLVEMVNVVSVLFDERKPSYPELRNQRIEYTEHPKMIQSRVEANGHFTRSNPRPIYPEELLLEGWPTELPGVDYWYFDGCSLAEWVEVEGAMIYRCTQVSDHLSTDVSRRSTYNLLS